MTTPEVPAGHIYIGDLPTDVVLAALFNNTPLEGIRQFQPPSFPMNIEYARGVLSDRSHALVIDKIAGRYIGLDPSSSTFNAAVYNSRNPQLGPDLAERIITQIRHVLTPELLADAIKDLWVADEPQPFYTIEQ